MDKIELLERKIKLVRQQFDELNALFAVQQKLAHTIREDYLNYLFNAETVLPSQRKQRILESNTKIAELIHLCKLERSNLKERHLQQIAELEKLEDEDQVKFSNTD